MSTLYETMYILRPDLGDEAVDQAISTYQDMLSEAGATDLETQHRGKRRLAYEINRHREGIYIQMNYAAPGTAIAPSTPPVSNAIKGAIAAVAFSISSDCAAASRT